jgi:hypothetical protein
LLAAWAETAGTMVGFPFSKGFGVASCYKPSADAVTRRDQRI